MLKQRIISTLRFFDLQDIPLTLFEVHKFLLGDMEGLRDMLDSRWELQGSIPPMEPASLGRVLHILDTECEAEVECDRGYYCLRGRKEIISKRLDNYAYGIIRERRIRRFLSGVRHVPFVRGVAIGGSQALGQQKNTSDIDLLIVTQHGWMWLARTLVSAYFQILGMRRYGENVKNRFCLNHYLARPKEVDRERNLYKAMEYGRLRPVVYPQNINILLQQNSAWINVFFPNLKFSATLVQAPSGVQRLLERLLSNLVGRWLERVLKNAELPRIHEDEYTFVLEDELSFHPGSRHEGLLERFFR